MDNWILAYSIIALVVIIVVITWNASARTTKFVMEIMEKKRLEQQIFHKSFSPISDGLSDEQRLSFNWNQHYAIIDKNSALQKLLIEKELEIQNLKTRNSDLKKLTYSEAKELHEKLIGILREIDKDRSVASDSSAFNKKS